MGRSQVLYNRTKGRNKNRPGRGAGNAQDRSSGGTLGRSGNRGKNTNLPPPQQRQPSKQHSSLGRRSPKDYEHEYEVLFAGRTTYLSSKRSEEETPGDAVILDSDDLLGTGSICIPSMAATLESVSITKRLRLPLRVAAKAFPEQFRNNNTKHSNEEEKQTEIHHRNTSDQKQEIQRKQTGPAEEETKKEPSSPVVDVDAAAYAPVANKTPSDPSTSKLEDWLDDACGIGTDGDDDGMQQDHPPNPTDSVTDSFPHGNVKTNALAKAADEEAYAGGVDDEDNLDDWLDGIIE